LEGGSKEKFTVILKGYASLGKHKGGGKCTGRGIAVWPENPLKYVGVTWEWATIKETK